MYVHNRWDTHATTLHFLHDLDLSNTYNKSPELLWNGPFFPAPCIIFCKTLKTQKLICAHCATIKQYMPSSMVQGTAGHFVPFYSSTTEWRLRALNNNQVNKLRAKFRTDRDPAQSEHTCPQPGRSLPEVTISWTAEGHTGCTGLGWTWQSVAPWPLDCFL